MLAEVIAEGIRLSEERDRLRTKLDAGEAWLQAHQDDPGRAEREDRWIGWLRRYEAVCDRLSALREDL